jgi:hypothetical protein
MSGSITVTPPYACWIGLTVGNTEIVGAGYARQPATLVYCADGTTVANNATIEWPEATADWGAIQYVQIWDAASAGNLLITLSPEVPVTVLQYDTARIQDAGIPTVVQSTPPRGFGRNLFGTGPYSTNRQFGPLGTLGEDSPFGLHGYGIGPYGVQPRGVLLDITFDTSGHVCATGLWAPGPFNIRVAA